jgi:hypothetical protein
MALFLTPDEVHDLTGYKRHADQRRWLSDRGWTFETAATGRPVVARSYAESRLGPSESTAGGPWMPNVAAIRRAA